MFANEAIGSMLPAKPASTAITGAACEGTTTVPSINWVARALGKVHAEVMIMPFCHRRMVVSLTRVMSVI